MSILALALIVWSPSGRPIAGRLNDQAVIVFYALTTRRASPYTPSTRSTVLGLQMPFDFQPCLQGGLLELRPLREEDFGDLYAVAADPLIWEQHPSKDRYQESVFKGFFRDALDSQSALTVIDCKDHRIIGSSRYHGYDEKRGEIEIGWTFLARSHWGGTCNRELKRLMLHHAFKFVSSVIFLVEADNLRSQRAVEKIGGVRSDSRTDGSGRKSLAYRIEACNWMDAAV